MKLKNVLLELAVEIITYVHLMFASCCQLSVYIAH